MTSLPINPFSPAQLVGYVSFVLGATAFLQRDDRKLKLYSCAQSVFYAIHFTMLGNLPASASGVVAAARSYLATRTRSMWLVIAAAVVMTMSGLAFAKSPLGWLPVVSTSIGTYAMCRLSGIRMRLVLLCCTFMWIANNVLSHSIGGTMLEVFIAIANSTTIVRALREQRTSDVIEAEVA